VERDGSVTSRLRAVDPVWWWVRENFKLPSLLTIAGCVLTAAAWLYMQHVDLVELKKHDPGPKLESIAAQLTAVLQAQSAMQQRLNDFADRIDEQERRWERAEQIASAPPRHRR
jgi:hypothetical protein